MNHRVAMRFGLAAVLFYVAVLTPISAQASGVKPRKARELLCFLVMEEGASPEGNSLYLHKMLADPEALRAFAPSRFTAGSGSFSLKSQGRLSYEAGSPSLKQRLGNLALYELPLRLFGPPLPKARNRVTVEFPLEELASSRGLLQPAQLAIKRAAAKLGWSSGQAWIVQMELIGPSMIRAIVGLAK